MYLSSDLGSAVAALKAVDGREILNKKIKIEYARKQSYKAMKPMEYYRLGKSMRSDKCIDNKVS